MTDKLFSSDSVRLGILRYIKTLYEAATDQTPAPSGKVYYGVTFSTVKIGPLSDPDARKLNAIGIHVDPETKIDLFPLKQSTLPINIEFRWTANRDDPDDPGVMAEKMLAVVQQVIYDDQSLGGLVIMANEESNEVDLVTYADRTVQGVVKFNVLYRHSTINVYDPNPTV